MSEDLMERISNLKNRISDTVELTHTTNEWYDFAENADSNYVAGYQKGMEDVTADLLKLGKYEIGYKSGRIYIKAGDKVPKGATVKTGRKGGKYYEKPKNESLGDGSKVKPKNQKISQKSIRKDIHGDDTAIEVRGGYVRQNYPQKDHKHSDVEDDIIAHEDKHYNYKE